MIPTDEPQTIERRPMRPRDWQVMRCIADRLGEMGVSPNTISLASVFFCIASGVAMWGTSYVDGFTTRLLWIGAIVGIQLRGLCNLFDGMVAVNRGIASPVGELFNEVPDRVSDAVMLVGLGYAANSTPEMGYLAAIVAVFVAYVRAQGRVAGASQDYCGPMAKPQRMFTVTFGCLFFVLTPTSWHEPWWGPDSQWGVLQLTLGIIIVGGLITAVRRLHRSGLALKNESHV